MKCDPCLLFIICSHQPEKWDSLTRSWKDHLFLLGAVDLLLLDEVHHLGEDRGSTLEIVVVRMRVLNRTCMERIKQHNEQDDRERLVVITRAPK